MSRAGNQQFIDLLLEFYQRYYREDILELAEHYPQEQESLTIDYSDLFQFRPELADDLREKPQPVLEHMEEALRLFDLPIDITLDATVRVAGVDDNVVSVSALRSRHLGDYAAVRGQVSKTSQVVPRIKEAVYECGRCGTLTTIPQTGLTLEGPGQCQGCERQGPFNINETQSTFEDHQLVELVELPEESNGSSDSEIQVHVTGDIAGWVQSGDRVKVNGEILMQQDDLISEKNPSTRRPPYLKGRAIDTEQSDYGDIEPERIDEIQELSEAPNLYELFIDSYAPKILGDERQRNIKLANILQLFGGVTADGLRDDIHVLIIGAPGTGKSQFLKESNRIAPRSVKVSGKGASAAGLTASATRGGFDGDQWMLEAGALVLASGGLACVDEFDKMNDDARKSMHEALEDQEIPINKAGINTTLQAKTSVLAAANPKYGRFDRYEPLGEQIELGSPILSRFDLIFGLMDNPNEARDRDIAEHQHTYSEERVEAEYRGGTEETAEPAIDRELLREYIAYARQNIHPNYANAQVKEACVEFYVETRQKNEDQSEDGDDPPVPVTARVNDSIRRLVQASARARLSEEITMEDVDRVKGIVNHTLGDTALTEDGYLDEDKGSGGLPKSQRDRIRNLKQLVSGIEDEYEEGAPVEEVIDQAGDTLGIGEGKAEHEIDKLKQKGELYEPSNKYLRTS